MEIAKLKKSNAIAAGVHLLTGLSVLIWYSYTKPAQTRSSFTAFRNTPATQADANNSCSTSNAPFEDPGKCNTEIAFTKPVKVVSLNVVVGSIAFFFITALAHFFYATDGFGAGSYTRSIAQGWNPYRWTEYAISASLMSVIIGLTDGTRDFTALMSLLFMTAAMMYNGYSIESLLRGHAKISEMAQDSIKISTIAGWLLFVGVWSVLFYSFATLVSDVKNKFAGQTDPDGNPIQVPGWIWFIVVFQLFYYALFGIVQARHIRARLSGKHFDFTKIEKSYIGLSYFAKLSLASGIGYGLIFRTKDCPV